MKGFMYDKKIEESRSKARIYCQSCGHSLILGKQDKIICDWCGHYVFKDKKVEFKYRLKEQLLRK